MSIPLRVGRTIPGKALMTGHRLATLTVDTTTHSKIPLFLALAKLLTPLTTPLGVSLVLMGLVLGLLWRQSRPPKWPIRWLSLAIVILWLGSSPLVAGSLVRGLEGQFQPASIPTAEAIVVLGGGTKAPLNPRPDVDLAEAGDRILYGSRLWKQGKAPWLVLSGGRAEWLKEGGPPESQDMATIAGWLGVPPEAILQDSTSLNTRENALNVKQILDQHRIRQVLLVTSATHMPRAIQTFRRLGIECFPAPTDFLMVDSNPQKGLIGTLVDFLPDAEALLNSHKALKEYLGLRVYQWRGWA